MPIASTQTQEGGCTLHWRRLFCAALYSDEHWSTGTLGHWDTGALGHWGTGTLGHWGTGALGHWDTGTLDRQRVNI